jgi:hypothetical protein
MGSDGDLGSPVDTDYSGHPMTFLPHRPVLTGVPWMYIADLSRMSKINADEVV